MRTPRPVRISITRYLDEKGRQVPKSTPGARKVVVRSESYYYRTKVGGKRKTIPLNTTDVGQAHINLRELLRRQEERRLGIRDDLTDWAEIPFDRHVEDWLESVRARGRQEADLDLISYRVRHLCQLAGWKRITSIDLDSANVGLARLVSEEGLSAQTRNHYATHARQFTRWLAERNRLARDPLRGLLKVSVDHDRRHDRRCPTDAEIATLFRYLEAARDRRGMTAPCRALLYRVAMATGFRAGELRSLTRESFDLERGTATVRAAYSRKAKKNATQRLPDWLVEELRLWFAGDGGLWGALPNRFPGQVLKEDLAAAGVPWQVEVDGVPLFFDFHAMRKWYISWAASLPGISPKTLMEMARHSDPRLTLRTYAAAKDAELKATIAQLPRPG